MTTPTRGTRRRVLFLAVCVLVALAFWFWPRPKRVNLLLVTLDTTRADHLGCYGHAGARTPVIDGLAAAGVLCEHACTVAPLTLPAHASLLTGLYPTESGVRTNGKGRLDDSIPMLSEVLQRAGYDTGAFVASLVLDAKFGLNRGFRKYDDDFTSDEPAPDALHRQRNGESVVDAALEWLQPRRTRPFFCWVHLYDPHIPYLPHADLFGDEFDGRPYDAEIAYVDRQVGRLVEFLKSHALDSQTLVVVVGDHGESLGEHLEKTHGSTLYDATMRVPLIFSQPGSVPPGTRLAGPLSLVDVPASILELLKVSDRGRIAGRSVVPAFSGADVERSACYSATDEPFLKNGWSPLRSLTEGSWKYIRTTRPELYDLEHDPGELHDLAEASPDRLQAMQSRMQAVESRLVSRAQVDVQLSPAERRALASLGYIGGAQAPVGPADPEVGPLPDIKDMLPFDVAIDDALELINEGSVEPAIERLRQIIQEAPSHVSAYLFLGNALQQQSAFDEARQVYESLLAVRPESSEAHYGIGLTRLGQNRLADAVDEFSKALEIDPDFAEAHYNLAVANVRMGNPQEALAHFDDAAQIDRCAAEVYLGRANLLVSLGRVAEAVADYRTALKYGPDSPETHHNLGVILADRGESAEALRHLQRAAELAPRTAGLQSALGAFLVRQKRYDEAIEPLTRALELNPDDPAAKAQLQEATAAAGGQPRPDTTHRDSSR